MNIAWGRGGGGVGGPRFRILVGGGGAREGGNFADCELIGATAPNQCQIITFLRLKTDTIAKLRLEQENILLEIHSNKIICTYIKLVLL